MKLKNLEASSDIEDRRDKSPPSKAKNKRSWAEKIQNFDDLTQSAKDRMIAKIAKESKTSAEFNAKVSELENKMKRGRDEADESASDAVRAWESASNGDKSPEMKKALEDISGVTKKFSSKKFRNAEGYAKGGLVRGFGKARGAKKAKVC